MKFDYFSCFLHKVIVDDENKQDHKTCDILGEMFVITAPARQVYKGLIARDLIEKAIEDNNVKRFEARKIKEKRKKILAQERYEKQINNGDVIINLEAVKI